MRTKPYGSLCNIFGDNPTRFLVCNPPAHRRLTDERERLGETGERPVALGGDTALKVLGHCELT